MGGAIEAKPLTFYTPRETKALSQDSLPSRYGRGVQWLSMAGFTLAFVGWLNESWLFLFENPIWLNRYTEYAIILLFGVWRIIAERNAYTRKRLIVLVAAVTVLWWLIPWLFPFFEPYVGYLWAQPVFPSLHVPGTITFFLVLAAVFLFGRRVICGWNCPCVGIRETVGFAFRDRTVRGKWAWRLRHSKWFFFVYYVGVMVVTQYPPNSWTVSFVGGFYGLVGLTYFGTFFAAPLVGNRFYCRYLCPYGATFGLLNHAGFYQIRLDAAKCNDCRRCEQVCDMGIPVWEQGKQFGRITGIEDCMGCGRCVVSCPTDALEIRDVRNLFRPGVKQTGSHLMKKAPIELLPRVEPEKRPVAERAGDWQEIYETPTLAHIQEQASRCLQCGVPGCRNACPLGNRIPDWLAAAAKGDIEKAAELAHTTSALPEVCGRLCPQHRLCEGACTRTKNDGAVTIGAIESYISDAALASGWRPNQASSKHKGRRVAVIGAGPAGLACAERLAREGVRVTVYDRADEIGGLLITGIPPFKLEKRVLNQRRALFEKNGIEFRLGAEAGRDELKPLLRTNDAVFLATGAQSARKPHLAGTELTGVHDALKFLRSINEENFQGAVNRRVLVLGGGDTAMDCARSAVRAGASSTIVACRAAADKLRASAREVEAARAEGVEFCFEHEPLCIEGSERAESVRFRTLAAGEARVQADAVILAFGLRPNPPVWLQDLGIVVNDKGCIEIDAEGRTANAKIYAGGDNTHGPDLVVTAMAAGRRAAEGILASFSFSRRVFAKATQALVVTPAQAVSASDAP